MNKNRIQLLTLFGLMILSFWACKPEQIQPSLVEDTSDNTYNESILNTAAIALLDLSQDEAFRKTVNEQVKEKFDGDYNVLLKTLFETKGDLLRNEMWSSLQKHAPTLVTENRTRFKDLGVINTIDGVNKSIGGFNAWNLRLYPQIYIPFIEEVDLNDQPTIVVGSEDGGDCIALGYKPIPNSKDYEVIEVDEAYAKKNLTWVVSTNESVNERGELPSEGKTVDLRASGLQVRHTEFYVTSQKECWLCGQGDLRVVWAHYDQSCNEIVGWAGASGDLEKINTNELNAWHEIDSDTYLIAGGQPNPFPANYTVAWVVYEHDNKPAITATFPTPCGISVDLNYRSNDSFYGKYGTEFSSFFAGNSSFSEIQQEIPYGSQNFRILSRDRP
jgi:hypothetical protein